MHNVIWAICERMQLSLKVGNWWLASCILPETGPYDSYPPTCFQKRCICLKPDQAIQIGSRSVLYNMIHVFFGKTEQKQMQEVRSGIYNPAGFWLHNGRNGHNWLYPKRFRIGCGMFTGCLPVLFCWTYQSEKCVVVFLGRGHSCYVL